MKRSIAEDFAATVLETDSGSNHFILCVSASKFVYCNIVSESMSVKKVTEHIETAEEQRELFLWKYRDISREDVNKMYDVSALLLCAWCTIPGVILYLVFFL